MLVHLHSACAIKQGLAVGNTLTGERLFIDNQWIMIVRGISCHLYSQHMSRHRR